ncbi:MULTISPECIES: glycosyltransferase [Brevibacillus]|uniref:glycosyltransferase family 2 protein n=1 Tax=Brevibacillus TaxID=55080 RepID=UPI0011588BAB|nr:MULTISPECIES: glycosyltransferase [Bacillales]NRR02391.1 glycosyltransferase family 2 protein [Brevibacillus sp. RS1.1]NRS51096.1 glycosyltransferase family 2 protein [Brevibacillus sp. HB2.2]TQR38750.1 glycosyltransferase family 2 protein [Lysinibacillus sp. SDF0063]WJQ82963.1 glycosyltransferase [Brevibacillus brevis]
MRDFLLYYGVFAVYYVIAINSLYFIIMLFSFKSIMGILKSSIYSRFQTLSGSEHVPPISILVPAYNEELTIIENVRSLLSLNYPRYEVLVVNDGSKDATLQVLIDEFSLVYSEHMPVQPLLHTSNIRGIYHNPAFPNLYLIDKENGGKADSLNAGINLSHYPLIASIDADSLLEKDALIRIAKVYMENPDETVAIGGDIRIANGCKIEDGVVKDIRLPDKFLPMMQSVEYLKAFLGGRIGWSAINGLIIVSGAFGVFRKDYIIKVGGYREGYPGEDMNIIIKLHKYMLENKLPYRVAFCPDAVCWTQAPDTLKILGSQRRRWGRGNLKNMIEYGRHMAFRPKYKLFGMLTLPFNILFETLNPYFRITGLLALIGYTLLDMTNGYVLLLYGLLNVLYGMLLGIGSLLLEEIAFRRYPRFQDIVKMLFYTILMFFGYRQIGVIWRFLGHIEYLRNNNSWGTMTRTSWQTKGSENISSLEARS